MNVSWGLLYLQLSRLGPVVSWSTLSSTLFGRVTKATSAVVGTAVGAAIGSFIYPGTGTYVCATIGSLVPFVLMSEGSAPIDDPRTESD